MFFLIDKCMTIRTLDGLSSVEVHAVIAWPRPNLALEWTGDIPGAELD